MRAPSSTPVGILTRSVLVAVVAPLPRHVSQGCSMIWPRPPHRGQVRAIWNGPWFTTVVPLPPHSEHVVGVVPGFAPEPLHVGHGAWPEMLSGTVVPEI